MGARVVPTQGKLHFLVVPPPSVHFTVGDFKVAITYLKALGHRSLRACVQSSVPLYACGPSVFHAPYIESRYVHVRLAK